MNRILSLLFFLPFAGTAQNTCATAMPITTGTYTTGIINGTMITGTNVCWGTTSQLGAHAEWYSYTPVADGMATVNTNFPINDGITLSNNIKLNVHTGSCGALQCYAADGLIFGTGPYLAQVTFEVRTGTTYFISFDDYYSIKGLQFELSLATPNCPSAMPVAENFATPLGFTCWRPFGGNSYQKWTYHGGMNLDPDPQRDPVAVAYPALNGNAPKNEWLVSSGILFEAGKNYSISIKYNALVFNGQAPAPNESLRTVMLTAQDPEQANETELGIVTGITQQGAYTPPYNGELASTVSYTFSPQVTGSYRIGLHAISPVTGGALVVYEVKADEALSTESFDNAGFMVYPNPATDKIRVNNTKGISIKSINVLDVNGRIMQSQASDEMVNISELAPGIYIMNIAHEGGTFTKKIIKT